MFSHKTCRHLYTEYVWEINSHLLISTESRFDFFCMCVYYKYDPVLFDLCSVNVNAVQSICPVLSLAWALPWFLANHWSSPSSSSTDIIPPLVPSVWWHPWHKSCHVALSTLGRLRLHLHKHPLLLSHPSTQPHSTIQRSEVMIREPENLWWCHQCVWGSLDWARSRKRSIAVIRRRRRAMSLWGPVFQGEKMARVVPAGRPSKSLSEVRCELYTASNCL